MTQNDTKTLTLLMTLMLCTLNQFAWSQDEMETDLKMLEGTTSPAAIPGGDILVSALFINAGNTILSNITVGVYLSTDTILSSDDVLINEVIVEVLYTYDALYKAELRESTNTIPYNTPIGEYFVIVKGDNEEQITEFDENNNLVVTSIEINPDSDKFVDLILEITDFPDTALSPSPRDFVYEFRYRKSNLSSASMWHYVQWPVPKFFISNDQEISSDDITLRDGYSFPLAGNQSGENGNYFSLPAGIPSGDYYLIGYVDIDNILPEINENNNTTIVPIRIETNNDISPDLELSLLVPVANPTAYTNMGLTYILTNTGLAPASNIQIHVGVCSDNNGVFENNFTFSQANGLVYSSLESSASAGNYHSINQLWIIPQLEAGQSETLTINIFTLNTDEKIILGEVQSFDGIDEDSTPNNLANCTTNEDDETHFVLGDNNISCLLGISAVNLPDTISPGNIITISATVKNNSNTTQSFPIALYQEAHYDPFDIHLISRGASSMIDNLTPEETRRIEFQVTLPDYLYVSSFDDPISRICLQDFFIDTPLQIGEERILSGCQKYPNQQPIIKYLPANLSIEYVYNESCFGFDGIPEVELRFTNHGTEATEHYTYVSINSSTFLPEDIRHGQIETGYIFGDEAIGDLYWEIPPLVQPGESVSLYNLYRFSAQDTAVFLNAYVDSYLSLITNISDIAESEIILHFDEDCNDCVCTDEDAPVCGVDSITYSNSCEAECAGITNYTSGECFTDGDHVDLEMEILGDNFNIYSHVPFQVRLTNTGTVNAEDVVVDFPFPDDFVYSESMTSRGSYHSFHERWDVGIVEVGETVVLDLILYALSNNTTTAYAQVASAHPDDVDSTPDNGTCCTPNEDDETAITISSNFQNGNGTSALSIPTANRDLEIKALYPNIVTNEMSIFVQSKLPTLLLRVYNLQGQEVMQQNYQNTEGFQRLDLEVSDLPAGVYLIRFDGTLGQETTKFIKLRM